MRFSKDVLYGWRESPNVTFRLGSSRVGGVVLRLSPIGALPAHWTGEVGRVGFSYGVAGGVEEGLASVPPRLLARCRVRYIGKGRALGLYLTRGGRAAT